MAEEQMLTQAVVVSAECILPDLNHVHTQNTVTRLKEATTG